MTQLTVINVDQYPIWWQNFCAPLSDGAAVSIHSIGIELLKHRAKLTFTDTVTLKFDSEESLILFLLRYS